MNNTIEMGDQLIFSITLKKGGNPTPDISVIPKNVSEIPRDLTRHYDYFDK
jgi:hypothetical protein